MIGYYFGCLGKDEYTSHVEGHALVGVEGRLVDCYVNGPLVSHTSSTLILGSAL